MKTMTVLTLALTTAPALADRVRYYADKAGSNARTKRGVIKAATAHYRAWRTEKHPHDFAVYRPRVALRSFSPLERESRRLKTDAAYRKLWAARQRRIMAKATAADIFLGTHATLIRQGMACEVRLDYFAATKAAASLLEITAKPAAAAVFGKAENYSGNTNTQIEYTTAAAEASTSTGQGCKYSRSCTYRKTDATHRLRLCVDPIAPQNLQHLATLPLDVVHASRQDGLPLISSGPVDSRACLATWATGGKPLGSRAGAMAWDWRGPVCVIYHADSIKAARKGLENKLAKMAETDAARAREKSGLPALWQPILTTSDVRRYTGWCAAGCREWISRHLGRATSRATWGEVAQAALRDHSSYGERLRSLLGVVPNGPYTF